MAGAEVEEPIVASRAPTGTVESTETSIEMITPDTGDGISVSTLSVETSSSGSSTLTVSPTFLSQRVTVPSVTLSPSAGIVTKVPEPVGEFVAAGAAGAGAAATCAGATGAGGGVGAGASATIGAAGAGVPAAPSAIIASSAPTGTVASTATTIFWRVPETGEGISVSTLSVETSSSGSSTLT